MASIAERGRYLALFFEMSGLRANISAVPYCYHTLKLWSSQSAVIKITCHDANPPKNIITGGQCSSGGFEEGQQHNRPRGYDNGAPMNY